MIKFNTRSFEKDMRNIIGYSFGFLEGVQSGKKVFLDNIGKDSVELMKQFIDANARVSPEMLHHVYEWNQAGSPAARLFDIQYTVSNLGLSFMSTFSQSRSVQSGSTTPFYDKARIMEQGIPVKITPKKSGVLAFESNGEMIFTKKPVTVANPGGDAVEGGLQKTIDQFFQYFSQAFLNSSGVGQYLKNPVAYKQGLPAGSRLGRSYGKGIGYRWIANAGVIN